MNISVLGSAWSRHMCTITSINGTLHLYFSHGILMAFSHKAKHNRKWNTLVRENTLDTSTGKFLNRLEPDHNKRVSEEEFKTELSKIISIT